MLKHLILALSLTLLATPALAEIHFLGGDGGTMADAVIIADAQGETDGVDSEYYWLSQHFPGYATDGQALLQDRDKIYDLLTIHHQGKQIEIYFDITGFFGKF